MTGLTPFWGYINIRNETEMNCSTTPYKTQLETNSLMISSSTVNTDSWQSLKQLRLKLKVWQLSPTMIVIWHILTKTYNLTKVPCTHTLIIIIINNNARRTGPFNNHRDLLSPVSMLLVLVLSCFYLLYLSKLPAFFNFYASCYFYPSSYAISA